jgi:hypothetical protein
MSCLAQTFHETDGVGTSARKPICFSAGETIATSGLAKMETIPLHQASSLLVIT